MQMSLEREIVKAGPEGWQAFGGECRVSYIDRRTGNEVIIRYQAIARAQNEDRELLIRRRLAEFQM